MGLVMQRSAKTTTSKDAANRRNNISIGPLPPKYPSQLLLGSMQWLGKILR